jgi:hypothetical protein
MRELPIQPLYRGWAIFAGDSILPLTVRDSADEAWNAWVLIRNQPREELEKRFKARLIDIVFALGQ